MRSSAILFHLTVHAVLSARAFVPACATQYSCKQPCTAKSFSCYATQFLVQLRASPAMLSNTIPCIPQVARSSIECDALTGNYVSVSCTQS